MDAFLVIFTVVIFLLLIFLLLKGLQPQFCLIIVGVIALVVMMYINGESVVEKSSGFLFADTFQYLADSLISSFTSTGITLCVVLGFVEFMNHIKASDMFALTCAKGVTKIKNKYVIMVLAMLICAVVKWVIPSAVTCLLMMIATIYPVLRAFGFGRITSVCLIGVATAWPLGPGQPFTGMVYGTFAPEVEMSAPLFFVTRELVYAVPAFIVCAVSFILVDKYFCKKEANYEHITPEAELAAEGTDTKSLGIPGWYGLLPIIPLVIVIIFGGAFSAIPVKFGVVPVYFFCTIAVIILEIFRLKSPKAAINEFAMFLEGMGLSFGRYATVAWAGVVFAEGLNRIGGLNIIINAIVNTDTNATLFFILVYVVVFVLVALTSQVMLGIFGLGPIISSFASITGTKAAWLLAPMATISTLSSCMSVAAAVTLVAAEKSGMPVINYAIRQAIPMAATALCIILCCAFMF